MQITGIIAEFNPLHKGHEYLLRSAKEKGAVVCVISGNFVQRGDLAIADKRIRAAAALSCGADLVLELPVLWSMSTAQNFALGGTSALGAAGCDTLLFGSECGDITALCSAAESLASKDFPERLSLHLKKGITFAKARELAAFDCGLKGDILSGANNNLAIEYILAAKQNGFGFNFETLARRGASHDSLEEAEFVSASLLREKLLSNDRDFCLKHMPKAAAELFTPDKLSDIKRIETAILAVLRLKSLEELKKLPDLSEGVENKLFSAIRLAESLEGLYNMVKVKRYTHARIRRMVLSAFIGADSSFFMKPLPYVRVLGFNKTGMGILKTAAANSKIPIITRAAEIKSLPEPSQRVFEAECRASDLFALSLPRPSECGLEYTSKIIKTE